MTSSSTYQKRAVGAVVVSLLALTACTSNPIAPVSDFDFVFDEIQAVDLGDPPDTSIVEINFEPAPDDTTYLETQERFLTDASSAPQSGSVPSSVVAAAEAAHNAFDQETSTRLAAFTDEASADPAAFVANLDAALEDPSMAAFAEQVTNLAQQQAALAALLGISSATSSLAVHPAAVPRPDLAPVFSVRGTSSCTDDARVQTQQQLDAISEKKADLEAAVQRALQRSIAAADTFRTAQIRGLAEQRLRRRAQAEQFFRDAQAAVEMLVQNGLITQVTASDLRLVSITVVLARLNEDRKFYVSSEADVHAAADAAIAAAHARYDLQTTQLRTSFDLAVVTLLQVESDVVQDCHDQGASTG